MRTAKATLTSHLSRRHRDDSSRIRNFGTAAAALIGVETLRRNYTQRDDCLLHGSVSAATTTDSAFQERLRSDLLRESLLSLVTPLSLVNRTACEDSEWVADRRAILRRRRTIAQLQKTAIKSTINSKYRINWQKPLGEGTFGKVYRAVDRKTGEPVAVKRISKKFTDNASFQQEMDALLHLRDNGGHPHICGLQENYEEGDYFYLVLDLVSGGEMFDQLCERGAYSEADAARLVREVASALSFMHGIGIVHGDMKPENLMLSSENSSDAVIKVVDFGCSHLKAEGKEDVVKRALTNTPAYSPPEILDRKHRKDAIEPQFDMWALGVIIYIMLTGIHPFDLYGNASDEEIESIIMSKHNRLHLRNSPITAHLSADAIDVIEQLLNWEPDMRLTALELLQNPWVRGETARTKKMVDSDKRLSAYREFKTKLEAKVFADMVAWSEETDGGDVTTRTSLIERFFQTLNPDTSGYVTAKDLHKLTSPGGRPAEDGDDDDDDDDEKLCLSGFSDLLAENMKNRYFQKGHEVYYEGDEGNVMYFINSGTIEVYTRDGYNKQVRSAGDFFGEGALMHPNKIRSASIRCVTPVHALEISREYFEKYLATEEGTMLDLKEKDRTRKRQRAKTILGLQSHMHEKVIKEGEYIFQPGDMGTDFYIVESGDLELSVDNFTVLHIGEGEMIGEHSLIFSRPRNVSVQCISDGCKLQAVRAREFYALLDSSLSVRDTMRDMCLRREFQKALCVKTQKAFPRTESELRAAFDAVDDKNVGAIDFDEMRSMLKDFDPLYTEDDVKEILVSLDLNDDSGSVSWGEFKRIFGMAGEQVTTSPVRTEDKAAGKDN